MQRPAARRACAAGAGRRPQPRRCAAAGSTSCSPSSTDLEPAAGLDALQGPGLVVTLDDAPRDQPGTDGIDPNLLVVHQQDIQAVVNALWAGGAEGITLAGPADRHRTTGIKCVGNTVVLQGVPYSPPYRIAAVGDQRAMDAALQASPDVQTYLQYTAAAVQPRLVAARASS